MRVRDVLDMFEKCPRCGSFAEAVETVRTFGNGRVERTILLTCGSPCGWHTIVR